MRLGRCGGLEIENERTLAPPGGAGIEQLTVRLWLLRAPASSRDAQAAVA